jgi:hypothetical protein
MPFSVHAGRTKVSCHKKKASANKKAKALRAAGRKKVSVRKRKSCA